MKREEVKNLPENTQQLSISTFLSINTVRLNGLNTLVKDIE